MCIYCGTDKYRKIYENHYGPIPKDETGRTYEIHHIDGNRKNNNPDNLKCVSVQEHYDIHYIQGDWAACLLISRNMKISLNEKAELARLFQLHRVEEGTHNFTSDLARKNALERVKNGTHHFLGDGEFQRSVQRKNIDNGTHHFLDKNAASLRHKKLLAEGKHHSQVKWKCLHCGKEGLGKSNYTRYHGSNCKLTS